MKNIDETRTLFGGVDTDSAPFLVDKGQLLNAMNVRPMLSKTQNTGQIEPIELTSMFTAVQDVLNAAGGTYTLIGKHADEVKNVAYWCFFSNLENIIVRYIASTGLASIFFKDSYVTGGLRWTGNLILSIRTLGDLFIFTDGYDVSSNMPNNEIRYLNTTKTYTAVNPITPDEISFVTNPFAAPLIGTRITDTSTKITIIQRSAVQFCYRITNTDGFISVLSIFSETILPVRESDLATNSSFGNAVSAKVNKLQLIPNNWQSVEFIIRYLADNTFYSIKTFNRDNPADVIAVNNHNTSGNPYALTTGNFYGNNGALIDDVTKVKPSDNVPIATTSLEIAQNRLLAANSIIGYDAPTETPLISINTNFYNTNQPTLTAYQTFLVSTRDSGDGADPWNGSTYAALFVEISGKVYSLPREVSPTRWNGGTSGQPWRLPDSQTPAYIPSQIISTDSLTPIQVPAGWPAGGLAAIALAGGASTFPGYETTYQEQLTTIVFQAHQMDRPVGSVFQDEFTGIFLFDTTSFISYNTYISNDPNEFGASGKSRAFLPSTKYQYGIRFYDNALRTCSVKDLGVLTTGDYAPFSRQLLESVTFTPNLASTIGIPSWATRFAITVSKNNTATQFINFCPNLLKSAFIDNDNVITIEDDNFNKFKGKKYYGIAVPLASLGKYNIGYTYQEGDYVRLSFADIQPGPPSGYSTESTFVYTIKTEQDGYIILGDNGDTASTGPLIRMSTTYNYIGGSTLDIPTGYARVVVDDSRGITERQRLCYVTIYQQPQSDFNQYEVAAVGYVNNSFITGFLQTDSSLFGPSYTVFGDCYTQKRTGNTGAFTGLSMTTNESVKNLASVNRWVEIIGRVAPVDTIGQQVVPNEIRWGNVGNLQSNLNGLASFDAADYRLSDLKAGAITSIILTTEGINAGGKLLVICENGSFGAMVGQQQFFNANNEVNVTASAPEVVNVINPIAGNYGCISPKTIVRYKNLVFWVDVNNFKVIQYSNDGATPISAFKNGRLWRQLLSRATSQNTSVNITGGVNPYASEYIVHVPQLPPATKSALPSVPTLEDPLDFYYTQNYSYGYNWDTNTWNWVWTNPDEILTLDMSVYGWNRLTRQMRILFGERIVNPGIRQMITIPFNDQYPEVKSPLSLTVDASRPPDETWVQCSPTGTNTNPISRQVAGIDSWSGRESDFSTAVRKNRLSNNATNTTQWNMSGINGWSVKGKIVNVVLIWYSDNGYFNVSSATLKSRISSGH